MAVAQTPQQEVDQWHAWTQAVDQARTSGNWAEWQRLQQAVPNGSDPRQYYAGQSLSQGADALVRSKRDGKIYNRDTNAWDTKSKIPWETWAQIAAAGGVAAPFVAAAVAPAALAPTTTGSAIAGANTVGPLAGGLVAPATEFAVPASLAGEGGTLAAVGTTAASALGPEGVAEGSALPTAGHLATGASAIEAAGAPAAGGFMNSMWGRLALAAAGRLGTAAIAAHGAKSAAATQKEYGDKALALQEPWLRTGTEAINSLESRMHLNQPAPAQPAAPSGGSDAGMVTMKAPTGETQQVPRWQAPFYQQKGAQLL